MTGQSYIHSYYELLEKWNRKINLIAVRDEDEFVKRHVDDARFLIDHLGDAKTLLDLGTGAGIPGIILKIERPGLEVVLVDATRKKVAFCEEAIRKLGLKGIRVVWGRAENPVMARQLGYFDVVVSRATWGLKEYLPIAAPYIAPGGGVIAMKGPKWEAELKEAADVIKKCDLVLEQGCGYHLADGRPRELLIFTPRCARTLHSANSNGYR